MKNAKIIDDNKALKERATKDLFSALFSDKIPNLTSLEQEILFEVLVNRKTFSELRKVNMLTISRQKSIFLNSLPKALHFLSSVREICDNYKSLEAELMYTKDKLKAINELSNEGKTVSKELMFLLQTPISETELSQRIKNSLYWWDIKLVSDLVKFSRLDFLKMRNIGKRSIEEIEDFLFSKGLTWKMKVMPNK